MKHINELVQVPLDYSEVRCSVWRSLLWQEGTWRNFKNWSPPFLKGIPSNWNCPFSTTVLCVCRHQQLFLLCSVIQSLRRSHKKSISLVQKHVRKPSDVICFHPDNWSGLWRPSPPPHGAWQAQDGITACGGCCISVWDPHPKNTEKMWDLKYLSGTCTSKLAANWWSDHPFTWNNLKIKEKVDFEK